MLIQSTEYFQLPNLARCHRAAFPKSLATALGQRYVIRMLSWYLSSSKTFLFHTKSEDGLIAGYFGGMISDGTLPTGSASGMAQHSFHAAIIAFITHPWVFFHPEVRAKWPLLKKNLLIRLGLRKKLDITPEQSQKMSAEPTVGLVVIGVDPEHQGKGLGSTLLREFERVALVDYGIKKLSLTVLADNHQAIQVYKKNGWQVGEVKGKSMNMYKFLN